MACAMGVTADPARTAAFGTVGAFIRSESEKWGKVVRTANISAQ